MMGTTPLTALPAVVAAARQVLFLRVQERPVKVAVAVRHPQTPLAPAAAAVALSVAMLQVQSPAMAARALLRQSRGRRLLMLAAGLGVKFTVPQQQSAELAAAEMVPQMRQTQRRAVPTSAAVAAVAEVMALFG